MTPDLLWDLDVEKLDTNLWEVTGYGKRWLVCYREDREDDTQRWYVANRYGKELDRYCRDSRSAICAVVADEERRYKEARKKAGLPVHKRKRRRR
jgi:hypothetical protein